MVGNYLRGWEVVVPQGNSLSADPKPFLEVMRSQVMLKLKEEVTALHGIKFQLALQVELQKTSQDGVVEHTSPVLHHRQEAMVGDTDDVEGALDRTTPHILELLEKWTQRGSGWAVSRVKALWLDIARYQPLRGSSYIPLPAAVKNKKAVVNPKNKDEMCAEYAILIDLYPVPHNPERVSWYKDKPKLKKEGIDFPLPVSQVPKLEKQNGLAINVFGWDKGVIVHHISKQPQAMRRINLLLIEKAGKSHYTTIVNLNRLLYNQSKHKHRKHFCERCLHGYSREDLLEAHKPDCRGIDQTAIQVDMPEDNKLTYKNHHKQLPAPYIIYADFEALTTKIEGPELNPLKSNTRKTTHHKVCCYAYIVVRCDGHTEPLIEYRGPNAAEHMLKALQEEENKIKEVLSNPKAIRMTQEDKQAHEDATNCHVCAKPLEGDSVRDHCHITGKYRGAAHNACNLKLRLNPKTTTILVVFHNLRGYDSHLLMQAISKVEGRISCIPNNMEKYISFSLGQLRFTDSTQFLPTSLDKLVSSTIGLPGLCKKCKATLKGEITQDWLFEGVCKKCEKPFSTKLNPEPLKATRGYNYNPHLLGRKGVYPYEYIDSWECFDEHQLPPRRPSTVSSQMSTSAMRTMLMRKRYGRSSTAKP